jgi:hypothetical protein
VEAALGTLVMVTVIVFGIHFAEMGYLSVKVTEAANFATFDATGRAIHSYSNQLDTSVGGAVTGAESAANGRYSDWSGDSAGGAAPRHLFTTASGLTVTCQVISGAGNVFPALVVSPALAGIYEDNDQVGMECSAQGQVNITGIGTFQESGDGYFKVAHVGAAPTLIRVCSTGRAWGGNGACQGRVPIMLGDWSMSRTGEYDECDLYDCNTPYKKTVETAFNATKGPSGKGIELATEITGVATPEGDYRFAFKGVESGYIQKMEYGAHWGPLEYTVTPGGPYDLVPQYTAAAGSRKEGFLGFPPEYTFSSKP